MFRLSSIFFILFLSFVDQVGACSMYKVTTDGKTMVGNNEDAWRITPHVWFETGRNGTYGCCFTGSRKIGRNAYAAQSGMNEHGLTFSRLTSYHPKIENTTNKGLKPILNPDQFLMDLLRTCKNIDEIYSKLDQYDRTCFLEDVFVFIEPSGQYLVVEPYLLILGSDASYVQSNFCPSITSESQRRNQERYRKGSDLLKNNINSSWDFCTNLSKEMHVCRDKIGDGTLLTSIWNTSDLQVKLFFYHDFDTSVSFDLMEELSKGDHQIEIESLFSKNEEFVQLGNYVTPFNTPWLRILLVFLGLLFAFSSAFFGISVFRAKKRKRTKSIRIMFSLVFILGFCFCVVLATNINIYYFPAPMISPSTIISIAAYIPYILLVLIIAISILFWKKREHISLGFLSKGLVILNFIALAGLFVGFVYWELF